MLVIWVLPSIVAFWLYSLYKSNEKPWLLIGGLINITYFGVIIIIALNLLNIEMSEIFYNLILLIPFLFILPIFLIIMTMPKIQTHISVTISVNPIPAFILTLVLAKIHINIFDSVNATTFIAVAIFSYILSYGIVKKICKMKVNNHNTVQDDDIITNIEDVRQLITKLLDRFDKWFISTLVLLSLFFFLIIIPIISLESGRYIRTNIPPISEETILYSKDRIGLQGHVVAYKDGLYYISSNWELVLIKSSEVLVNVTKYNE